MNTETKKNAPTPSEFQKAIQEALNPVLEKYLPKGSKRALIVASFDGEDKTETSVLCGIAGNSVGLVKSIKSIINEPAVMPYFQQAMNELDHEDMMRELLGAAPDCDCPGCTAKREEKSKRKVDPNVN